MLEMPFRERSSYLLIRTHRIFSSCVPRVMRTNAEIKSLKLMPLAVPPQAWNSQSAMLPGVPSHKTSCTNAFLLRRLPFEPADRLNASLIRRSSASDTEKRRDKRDVIAVN